MQIATFEPKMRENFTHVGLSFRFTITPNAIEELTPIGDMVLSLYSVARTRFGRDLFEGGSLLSLLQQERGARQVVDERPLGGLGDRHTNGSPLTLVVRAECLLFGCCMLGGLVQNYQRNILFTLINPNQKEPQHQKISLPKISITQLSLGKYLEITHLGTLQLFVKSKEQSYRRRNGYYNSEPDPPGINLPTGYHTLTEFEVYVGNY